jgi:hypothetical protein
LRDVVVEDRDGAGVVDLVRDVALAKKAPPDLGVLREPGVEHKRRE